MRHILRLPLLLTLLVTQMSVYSQVNNDDCQFAKAITVSSNYCSADGEFTNVGAKMESQTFPQNNCVSLEWKNGVWFSFVPREPAALIRVFGSGNGGTIRNPKIIIFEKCGDYLQCTPGKSIGFAELTITDLTIGQTYFIMVECPPASEGTFKLCLDDFFPTPSPESDCKDGVVLCDKSPFKIEFLQTAGSVTDELDTKSCLSIEDASSWYKWTCDQSGTLSFTLTPNDFRGRNFESDDLDFAIYELPGGIDDCTNKKIVRCMAAGSNGGNLSGWIECNGETGLRDGEPEVSEDAGCRESDDNNWLKSLDMVSGKSYVLIINNFSRTGLGFSIEFGGSGTFLGPKVDFEILAQNKFECDKTMTFVDKSTSTTDAIVSYKWNFGARATPDRSSDMGPIDVIYSGFGNKTAALTIESSRGCVVSKVIDFYVDGCCKDTSTLSLNTDAVDILCFGQATGRIEAKGVRGSGEYQYSIDGTNFQPNPNFVELTPGIYSVFITDLKGCRDTMNDIVVNEPPQITIDAGPDQEIDLGESTIMDGSFVSFNGADTLLWQPASDFDINGIVNPEVFPKNTTTYTFTIIDNNGCTKEDQMTIRVKKSYVIHAPNIFTPKLIITRPSQNSPNNDFFNIWTTKGVKYVESLEVYDRWGNMVYKDRDILADPNPGTLVTSSTTSGWDGTFRNKPYDNDIPIQNQSGKPVNPGVFTWKAKVRFIDDFVKDFAGDVTVVK